MVKDPEENEKSEVPKEQAARESKHISGSTADEEKPGRESGATKPGYRVLDRSILIVQCDGGFRQNRK